MLRSIALLLTLCCAAAFPAPSRAAEPPPPPNDPLYPDQWDLGPDTAFGIDLVQAWRFGQGEGVTIAVLDTGITSHPEFEDRVLPGYDFVSDSVRSGDGDGRDADPSDPGDWIGDTDVQTIKYGPRCMETVDSSWHGTHVAGTILASANNGSGIAGIAPKARLLPVRVIGHCGGSESDLVDAMRWSGGLTVDGTPNNPNPARILNVSLVIERTCSPEMQAAVDELASIEVIVVTSVGNDNTEAARFAPANCVGTLTVGASTHRGGRATYSNYGSAVDVSAPGGDSSAAFGILSTYNRGLTTPAAADFARLSGTSMAAPHVVGLLAVAIGAEPDLPRVDLLDLFGRGLAPFASGSACTAIQRLCGLGLASGMRLYEVFSARTASVSTLQAPTELAVGGRSGISAIVDGTPVTLANLTPLTCTVDGSEIVALASGRCELSFRRSGSASHQPVNLSVAIVILGNTPTLQVVAPAKLRIGQRKTLTIATNSDAVPVVTSKTPRVCKVGASGRIRGLATGICRLEVRVIASAIWEGRSSKVRIIVIR